MSNFKLPEPKYNIELIVQGKQHFYDVTYKGITTRYSGVTGILSVINKPALINWAKREALSLVEDTLLKRLNGRKSARITLNRTWIDALLTDAKKRPETLKDEAADLGTQAHAFIDLIIHGVEPTQIPEEISAPVNSFKDWWKNSGIQLIAGDTKVASIEYGYGGSLDALGIRNGELVVLDWKTGSGIYLEYALQVAAYAQAFYETYGIECKSAVIVRFGKKPPIEFEKKEVLDLKQTFEAFLAAKQLKEMLSKTHFIEW